MAGSPERPVDTDPPNWNEHHDLLKLDIQMITAKLQEPGHHRHRLRPIIRKVSTHYTKGLEVETEHPNGLLAQLCGIKDRVYTNRGTLYPPAVYRPLLVDVMAILAYQDLKPIFALRSANAQDALDSLMNKYDSKNRPVEREVLNRLNGMRINDINQYGEAWPQFRSSDRAQMLFGEARISAIDDMMFSNALEGVNDLYEGTKYIENLGWFPRVEAADALFTIAKDTVNSETNLSRWRAAQLGLYHLSDGGVPDSLGEYAEVARIGGISRFRTIAHDPNLLGSYMDAVSCLKTYRGAMRTADPAQIDHAEKNMRSSRDNFLAETAMTAFLK